ncbi:MAG: L-lysine exporter family protein LysE/ArgO [Paracoccaceae bacterium]|jgi:L-lysine exporter family protein LysE/ArgO
MIGAATTGFLTGFSLILAIGAQNAFVLRQGLLRQHVFALCLLCAVSDAILIVFGVAGFGFLVKLSPRFPDIMAVGGSMFLVYYGAVRLYSAYKGASGLANTSANKGALWPVLLLGLALTWLNPHVYLDTVGLIGAISSQYVIAGEKVAFGAAAALASFVFFFSLGYGARFLAPIMQTRKAWQIFDLLVAAIMFMIAFGLVISVF